MQSPPASAKERVLTRLSTLRQHQQQGQRSLHKPLLVLLALGRLVRHGTNAIGWSVAERELAELIRDYGQRHGSWSRPSSRRRSRRTFSWPSGSTPTTSSAAPSPPLPADATPPGLPRS